MDGQRARLAPVEFVRANTRLIPVRTIPEIRLHTAHEATGLWRLADEEATGADAPPPYWAFPWAGGMALARYVLDRPETVRGQRVLDLGAGSGVVTIAAALAGARTVSAAEVDPYAAAAIALNAAANAVTVTVVAGDITGGPAPDADVVLVGDLFYESGVAARVTAFLDCCLAAGLAVFVGDPGRMYLPNARLRRLAEYAVPDVGEVENEKMGLSRVFAWQAG